MFDIKNNTEFLAAIGIDKAPEDVKETLIAGIEDLAQKRLIVRLSDKLSDAQLEEFEKITDEAQVRDWLHKNVPDFMDIVTDVFDEIKREIISRKAGIVGA